MTMLRELIKVPPPVFQLQKIGVLELLDHFLVFSHVVVEVLVQEMGLVQEDKGPHALCLGGQVQVYSVLSAVAHEGAEFLVVYLSDYEQEEVFVELKVLWELYLHLVYAIQELGENGGPLALLPVVTVLTVSKVEHVAKGKPIFFDQSDEALYGSEVWVEHDLR